MGVIVFKTRVARQSTLESRRNQLGMRIDIIDDGPGNPDEIRGQIFYPLVSGRERRSGLGLAVAQNVDCAKTTAPSTVKAIRGVPFFDFLPLPT